MKKLLALCALFLFGCVAFSKPSQEPLLLEWDSPRSWIGACPTWLLQDFVELTGEDYELTKVVHRSQSSLYIFQKRGTEIGIGLGTFRALRAIRISKGVDSFEKIKYCVKGTKNTHKTLYFRYKER